MIAVVGAPTVRAQDRPLLSAADFPSIQAAVDVLPAGGGTVLVPAGSYVLTKKVRLPSHVELRGEGIERTVLSLADGANDHLISNRDLRAGNTDIAIRDLGLRGNASNQSDWSFGVRFVNVTNSVIERVEANDFTKDGFYLGYNSGNGVRNVRVSDCRAAGNYRYGIALKHGMANVIEGCMFEGNGFVDGGSGVKLGPDQGLDASNNRIARNRVVGNYDGIVLFAAIGYDSHVGNNLVCENDVENNLQHGLQDFRGDGNRFIANRVSGNGIDVELSETSDLEHGDCP
jgi:parallel beta-helix repeat protein